jgi:hypothetical protein
VASAFARGGDFERDEVAQSPTMPTIGPMALLVTPVVDPAALERACEHIRARVQQALTEAFVAAADQMHAGGGDRD